MKRTLLLDPSIGSLNKGDEIIMECAEKELAPFLENHFTLRLPTQVSPFHWYQVARNSSRVKIYSNCENKFVCGSNLLIKDLLTHFPQWNINILNYQPLKGSVLVGVGAGAGEKSNRYTEIIYKKMLHPNYYHSVRDERSKQFVKSLGLKAINTGCVTMWALTPEFCSQIPCKKSDRVVFTLTAQSSLKEYSVELLKILRKEYDDIWFWPQGFGDDLFLHRLGDVSDIHFIKPSREAYHHYLLEYDTDYVGTRLHGGVYAMRHLKRSIILSIDERARSIHDSNNLNCLEINRLDKLSKYIKSSFPTTVKMDIESITRWKNQF